MDKYIISNINAIILKKNQKNLEGNCMKIRIASDLHIDLNTEWFNVTKDDIIKKLNLKNIDVLILAGDTAEYPNNLNFCEYVLNLYPNLQIVEIPGNHLYYSCSKFHISMDEVDARCWSFARPMVRYHFLNNDCVKIGDVTFIGCTMWTKCGEHFGEQFKIAQSMNDFKCILNKKLQTISIGDIQKEHEKAKRFIRKSLKENEGKCVVVTHHAPFFEYHSDISHAFGIDLSKMIKRLKHKPEYWIYGHTHINKNMEIEGVKVLCNQFGYKSENEYGSQFNTWKTFNSNTEIEL